MEFPYRDILVLVQLPRLLFEIPRLELSKLTRVVISNAIDAFTSSLFYFNTINWNVKDDIS